MHHRIKLKSNQSDLTGSAFGVFGLLAGFTILAGALTMAAPVNADDNDLVDSFDIQILAACTMATTNTPGNTYAASMMPGASTVLGDTSIKTVCNDSNGYSIYTVGFSGNSYTGNNNKLIGSTGNINTGTSGSDSYWAMKILPDGSTYVPTIVNGFDSSSFHEVPASFTQAVKLTSATDAGTGATGSNVKASYKISLSSTQVADTYTGKVKYVLVHPNTFIPGTYSITYNANGGSGTMTGESGISNMAEHTLVTNTFIAPSGYKFTGWCTTNTSQNTCTDGDFYTNGAIIEAGTIATNTTLNLYAIWDEIPKVYMQELNSTSIATLLPNIGDTIVAYDNRDEESYLIGKLADGRYWMLDNLRLDPTVTSLATLQNNTNASSQTLAFLKNGGGSEPYAPIAVSSGWESSAQDQYNLPYVHTADKDNTIFSYGSGSGKIGVYYNYCAASAGGYCYSSASPSTDPDPTSLVDVKEDLCPTGWRMPTGGEGGEYEALFSAYSDNVANFENVLSITLTGYFFSGHIGWQGEGQFGYFWSSTRSNASSIHDLVVYSNISVYASGFARYGGLPIHCILKP